MWNLFLINADGSTQDTSGESYSSDPSSCGQKGLRSRLVLTKPIFHQNNSLGLFYHPAFVLLQCVWSLCVMMKPQLARWHHKERYLFHVLALVLIKQAKCSGEGLMMEQSLFDLVGRLPSIHKRSSVNRIQNMVGHRLLRTFVWSMERGGEAVGG